MKNWIVSVVVIASMAASSAIAYDPTTQQETQNSDQQHRFDIYLEKNSVPNRQPYTFSQYLDDLTESTRATDVDSKNPVRQLEARNKHKYEPLNPIILFRW
jgi:hypothetical protein